MQISKCHYWPKNHANIAKNKPGHKNCQFLQETLGVSGRKSVSSFSVPDFSLSPGVKVHLEDLRDVGVGDVCLTKVLAHQCQVLLGVGDARVFDGAHNLE